MAKKKRRRTRQLGALERDILEQLAAGDFLYAFLLSARSTRLFYKLARERAASRYRRKLAIERMKDLGYISQLGESLSITSTGKSLLSRTALKTRDLLQKPTTWDKKWRIAAFDIPERYADLRDKVRYVLKRAGFIKLQQSVWIFPYECEELVKLIQEESGLSEYVLYGVLERIEDEARLKKHFKL